MTLPFQALLPYDQRILILDYQIFLPICYEQIAEESLSSDSSSDSSSD